MPGTYSVRAASSIARRGAGHNRRRAGLVFGEGETVVSTEGAAGSTAVTEQQLQAILADSNLRPAESTETTEPGLRAKKIGNAPPAHADAPIPLVPFQADEDAEDAEHQGSAPLPKRGRPRKVV